MKKICIVLVALFCSSLFANEKVNKNIDYQNEIYLSVGLPSGYTLGESFFDYASTKMPDTDYDFLYPKGPGIEMGFSHFFMPNFAAGFECNYEMGQYTVYNSESSLKIKDDFNHRISLMGNVSFLFPKKYFITYIKLGAGACFNVGSHWENYVKVIPAIQFCPVGLKFLFGNDISLFTELNIGMNNFLSVGLTKGF